MKNIRLHIVLLAFIVVLLIGFLGQKVLYTQQIEKPLEERFAAIEGVESVELTGKGGQQELVISLAKVGQLDQTYREIVRTARSILGEDFDSIRLIDKRNTRLNDALHASHFAIEEGIATGRFTQMAHEVASVMESLGIEDFRLAVDETNVYLQIADKENYLFSVFPRQRTSLAVRLVS